MSTRIPRLSILILLFGLAACAGVPKPQLQAYASAFDDMAGAASLIYADAAVPIMKGKDEAPEPYPISLGPKTFDRENCGQTVAALASLRARCQAILAVKAYNQGLLDISSGKSDSDVKRRLNSALHHLGLLQSALPAAAPLVPELALVAPLIGPLSTILNEASKANDRKEMLQVLLRGEDGIRRFMAALRMDVDELYRIHRQYTEDKLLNTQVEINRLIRPMITTVQARMPPTDRSAALLYQVVQERFEQVFMFPEPKTAVRLKAVQFSASPSNPVLDVTTVRDFDRRLSDASALVAQFQSEAARYNRTVQALRQFDALIGSWERSLDDLIRAAQQPYPTGADTEKTIQALIEVRDQAREIQRLLAGQRR